MKTKRNNQTRVHIIGSGPRCGTTLLFEAMKVSFDFEAAPEHEAPICQSRFEFAATGRVLTKYPGEIDLIRWPLKLDPSLIVICIIRDPRDMVSSTHGGRPGCYWASLKFWKLFLRHIGHVREHSRFMLVRYEDLVTDPDGTQERLRHRFPCLSKKHPFSAYHEHAKPSELSSAALNGVRPIQPKGVGTWRANLPRLKQQIQLHGPIGASLIQFGYEKDRAWEAVLNDVLPGNYQTATNEFLEKGFAARRRRRNALAVTRLLIERAGLPSNTVLLPFRTAYRFLRMRRTDKKIAP